MDRRLADGDRAGAPPHLQGGVAHGHRRQSRCAAVEISSIKVVVPNMALRVVDRAIQAHGGGGVSDDFPLGPHVRRAAHPALRRRPRRGPPAPGGTLRTGPLFLNAVDGQLATAPADRVVGLGLRSRVAVHHHPHHRAAFVGETYISSVSASMMGIPKPPSRSGSGSGNPTGPSGSSKPPAESATLTSIRSGETTTRIRTRSSTWRMACARNEFVTDSDTTSRRSSRRASSSHPACRACSATKFRACAMN